MTVPSLIAKYQKEQTVTRLKKAYSELSQTTNRAIADNGPIATWDIGKNYDPEAALVFSKKYITPYLSLMVEPRILNKTNWYKYYYQANNKQSFYTSVYIRFYLSDGTSMTCRLINSAPFQEFFVYVDLNGDKKPNKFGRDIFVYDYYLNHSDKKVIGKFLPWGYDQSTDTNCNKNATGYTCASKIMKDGWQISDDYPW